MKKAERIVMVVLLLALVTGGGWIYGAIKHEQAQVREAVARGEYETPITETEKKVSPEDWRTIYPNTLPLVIGSTTVEASVADSLPERIEGLSNTPFLPVGVVKLFAFGSLSKHSIWMKDMLYPLDIMWISEKGVIVHIEENVSPDSYPQSFTPPVPAWYVVEANAGFTASNTIAIGDTVVLLAQ